MTIRPIPTVRKRWLIIAGSLLLITIVFAILFHYTWLILGGLVVLITALNVGRDRVNRKKNIIIDDNNITLYNGTIPLDTIKEVKESVSYIRNREHFIIFVDNNGKSTSYHVDYLPRKEVLNLVQYLNQIVKQRNNN